MFALTYVAIYFFSFFLSLMLFHIFLFVFNAVSDELGPSECPVLYWLLTSLLKLCLACLSLVLYKVLMEMEVFGFRLTSLHFIVWKESLIVGVVCLLCHVR